MALISMIVSGGQTGVDRGSFRGRCDLEGKKKWKKILKI